MTLPAQAARILGVPRPRHQRRNRRTGRRPDHPRSARCRLLQPAASPPANGRFLTVHIGNRIPGLGRFRTFREPRVRDNNQSEAAVRIRQANDGLWALGDKRHWPRRVAQAPAGFRRLDSVPVVFFPLVANRAHDNVVADDLEQNDVARAAEWNDQFARSTIAQFCSTA